MGRRGNGTIRRRRPSIVVALDGSADAEKKLPYVETLARSFHSGILLVGATDSAEMIIAETMPTGGLFAEPPAVVDPMPIVKQEQRDTSAYLATVADRLRAQGIAVGYQQTEGPPADAILAVAENNDADLIAMTTYGRGGVGRLIFGSIAEEVLRQAPCPILLVRLIDELGVTPIVDVARAAPDPSEQTVPVV